MNRTGAGRGTTGGVPQMTPDEICIQLADAADRDLVGAIMACREQRETMTPLLLKWFRQSLDELREEEDEFVPDELPFHVLYVLAEFDAREALPIVMEALRLPGDDVRRFLGDGLPALVPRVLATWDTDDLKHVRELLLDQSLQTEIRSEVSHALLFRIRDGRLTRQEAAQWLREVLRECCSHKDKSGVTAAVYALCQFGPTEASEEIAEAYHRGLVDTIEWSRDDWHEAAETPVEAFDEQIATLPPGPVEDAAEELEEWYSADEEFDEDYEPEGPDLDEWLGEEPEPLEPPVPATPSVTVHNEAPKVGRNDPCPCGSGKKYKKCCGKAG
ncbi:hypothetical protein Mal4_02950 [Maioricimonas rarisocia]|uniref:Preprotein translocase subunit SecA n=1 Tax=Maioricimonas rarisocia TaxID=2528026 RepID=A0A517Z0J8_9PLAN|nr:DUF1186 domain-containing protein [Maioricimonas rarisocia]QDU36012.1 hypothetical protein Mal4_02950 [Maioricimonas rarisocia]